MLYTAEQDQRTMAVTYTLKIEYRDIIKAERKNNGGVLIRDTKNDYIPIYLKLYGLSILTRQIENSQNTKEEKMKDKYDKIYLDKIKPMKLYTDIDDEMSNIKTHLDLLQAVVGNSLLAMKVTNILDSIEELHQSFVDLKGYIPAKNVFMSLQEEK